MTILIPIGFIAATAFLLTRKLYPQAVLFFIGLAMLILSLILYGEGIDMFSPTGSQFFDLFELIAEIFASKLSGVGLMIMSIGGFVTVMDEIGASKALVSISLAPIKALSKTPYIASVLLIPIGQFLFMCTPSAAGLGLLLMASVYPLLINLGISRFSAVSVITATTVFDLGPASANSNQAAEIVGLSAVDYFLSYQLPTVIPLTALMMVVFYMINKRADKKLKAEPQKESLPAVEENKDPKEEELAPNLFAILPVFPLILLIIFSEFFQLFSPPIRLVTTTAIIFSFFVALLFQSIRRKSFLPAFDLFKVFWKGMAKVFSSVVTLIIAAEFFASGLIQLGFIADLVSITKSMGAGMDGVTTVMTTLIYGSSFLLGSGNASFFAFSPLTPDIAMQVGGEAVDMVLPMQLAASLGRAISPIAGVIIATSELAGLTSFQLARRNLLPLSLVFIALILLTLFT